MESAVTSPPVVKHNDQQDQMTSITKKPSMDSISSNNTSIHSSRSSSMDHARDSSTIATRSLTRSPSSPLPTPIESSRSSRFKPPPLSPRSFRSSRSSRKTTAPLKFHGLPKTPGVSSPNDGSRMSHIDNRTKGDADTYSPPFSPRSFRSIFSGSNVHSPSAGSEFSTTTTILSVPETSSAAVSPGGGKGAGSPSAGTSRTQTAAPLLYNRSIPRSKNHVDDTPPLPTPSFFEPRVGPMNEQSTSTVPGGRVDNKENPGALGKLAMKFKGILGSSGGDSKTKRNKSLDKPIKPRQGKLVVDKVESTHWTEL